MIIIKLLTLINLHFIKLINYLKNPINHLKTKVKHNLII